MAAVSKRQQARNERELHELLRVPGNSQCADCGARNPGWASWSLGIFVCMRCASIHRKLGTHISKVKSLSMDTWNSDQVENMKRTGNTAVNKVYNPKNKRPDIPLDADEVDSAMERFIRKKYQERSLAEGRPKPPQRPQTQTHEPEYESSPPVPPKSPENSPPPPVPSKKGRFFGFGLRASSSAYPLSKHDKKKLPPEPRVESAWTIDSDRIGSGSRMDDARAPITDSELQRKLVQLKDMGFSDKERNTNMLKRLDGDVERTVEALVQLGPGIAQRSSSAKVSHDPTGSSRTDAATAAASDSAPSATRSSTASNNPWDMPTTTQSFGISMAPPQLPQATGASYGSNNPFDQSARSQTDAGVAQAFGGMHISQPASQPLFPHNTGGYPLQQPQIPDPRLQTMTPPVPAFSHQQYGYTASPSAIVVNTNPFFQTIPQQPQMQPQIQSQATGNNPFFSQMQQPQHQQIGNSASANPFVMGAPQQQQQPLGSIHNPFGIPPSSQSPPQISQSQVQVQPIQTGFQIPSQPTTLSPTNPFQQQMQAQSQQPPVSPQFPNFQYGQPQQQHYQQSQQVPQQSFAQFQNSSNPYASLQQPQSQFNQPIQPTQLVPQQTGRYDKQSILALYNYPQLAPANPQGLSSIPEPAHENSQFQDVGQPRRSATMPLSMGSMHSAGGAGMSTTNRNPFMQNNVGGTPQQQQVQPQPGVMARHASQESVNINNLENGRHSPDAFANLSARYVRS